MLRGNNPRSDHVLNRAKMSRQTQLTITKLERALEDVLEKLDMPTLDLYVSPAIVGPHQPPRSTRHNSEDPASNERNVSPAPMNSLIEVTQLSGVRSQLRSAKQRRKGGMRRMDSDLISEKLITVEEAEEMLVLSVFISKRVYLANKVQISKDTVTSLIFRHHFSRRDSGINQNFFHGFIHCHHACYSFTYTR